MVKKTLFLLAFFISSEGRATDATLMAEEILADSLKVDTSTDAQEIASQIGEDSRKLEGQDEVQDEVRKVLDEQDTLETLGETPPVQKESQSLKPNLKKGKACGERGKCHSEIHGFAPPKTNTGSQIIIFVSFSLSDKSLVSYAEDARKIGARLVIRGLINNSFKETQRKLTDLQIPLDIDPPLFETYNVTHVPTFVHVAPQMGRMIPAYDSLKGHVSLSYALEVFKDRGEVPGADAFLGLLKGEGA